MHKLRKRFLILLVLVLSIFVAGCGVTAKTVHCDHCGKEIKLTGNSNIEESWIIYCKDCQVELGLDNLIE